jgi:glycosyltransferase involved in cell wall biosynthesis
VVVQRDGTLLHACESPEVLAAIESLAGERPGTYPDGTDGPERLATIERTFCPDHLISVLARIDGRFRPDVVVCNYGFTSRFLPFLRDAALKVIDTHDVFSTKKEKVVQFGIADELAVTGPEEAGLLSRGDLLIAIQPEEQEELEAILPGKQVITAGVDFDRPARVSPPPADPVALLVASDNALNVSGARDLLSLAWPLVRRSCPGARLLIAGKVCDALEGTPEGVELLGYADDLEALYARARVVLNPAVAGTGLKIKTLESLAHLRPTVVWPSGTDGLSPTLRSSCSVASNWYEFAQKVTEGLSGRASSNLLDKKEEIWRELSPEVVYAELDRVLAAELGPELQRQAQPG